MLGRYRHTTMAMIWTALTLLMFAATQSESLPRKSIQNRLLGDLLQNYSFTSMRPVYNVSQLTTVEFLLLLTQVIELNERQQTIEIEAWISQRWTDEYMWWDPEEYDGVDHLFVHKSKIWLPDTTLYKNVDRDFESYKDIPVYITSAGVVEWATPAIFKSTCLIDARLFPFDTQVCELRFTSWAFDITELNLTEYSESTRQSYYTDVGVWELLEVTVVRQEMDFGGVVYPDLSYFIHLRRRPLYYVLQIFIPCVLLSLLNLMVFVLPPESGEKISLGVTNLLSLILFQQIINGRMPPTANNAPIIGYYFTPMIALACTSIVCTVAVLNVFYRDSGRPIPRWVRLIVFDILARLVCHPQTSTSIVKSRSDNERFLIREPGSMETDHGLAVTSEDATGRAGEASPSVSFYGQVADSEGDGQLTKSRYKTMNVTQRLRAVARSKTFDSPVTRARRQVHGEAESRLDRYKPRLLRPRSWKEVALVLDRTALVLSSVVTFGAMGATLISFIVELQEV